MKNPLYKWGFLTGLYVRIESQIYQGAIPWPHLMKYLYLIQARINEPLAYKIGVSSNPEHRRQQLQGSNFALLETICTFQTTQYRFLEKWLHNQFDKYHFINGGQEWFEPKNAILSGVKRLKNLFESIDENGHDTIACSNHKFLLDYMIGYVESLPGWLKNID